MSDVVLPYVEINPVDAADAVVIWLHGLGDSGNGFAPIVPQLALPSSMAVRFVFPHAPTIPVTINGGMQMPAWYDIKSLSFEDRADMEGVKRSAQQIEQLIQQEMKTGIASERIVLAGFSQGGVIAYYVSLRLQYKLAGILALSTYMCDEDQHRAGWTDVNKTTSIFSSHGAYDEMVPIALGKSAHLNLKEAGL